MKSRFRLSIPAKLLTLPFACWLGALPCSGISQISEEARQCFEWFDTLGYPDFKNARWAEVWTGGHAFIEGLGYSTRTSLSAFVIGEAGEEFTALSTSLIQDTLRKTAEGTPSDKRIDFEERPFRPFIEEQIQKLRQYEIIFTATHDSNLDLKSETFVLAYVCWVRGKLDLADELYTLAEGIRLQDAASKGNKPMRESLEIGLGHLEMSRAVLDCGGRTLMLMAPWDQPTSTLKPRKELAAAFRQIERNFPASRHASKAAEMATVLERMVEEDNEHPAIPPDEWNNLPQDRRIAELVWRLRDQTRSQFSMNDGVDLRRSDTPGSQLIEIGYPAVPALIEVLTDQRLSRAAGKSILTFRQFPSVLTVGDCARQTLYEIIGRNFPLPASEGSDASDPERIQEQAREWWAEVQRKGKKQMLIDTIASGEISPRPLVRQLREEAPEAVADALLRGAAAASDGHLLSRFISELGRLAGPEPIRFLKEIAEGHAEQSIRLQAARCLLQLDVDSAVPLLLAEWKHFPPGKDETGGRSAYSDIVHLLVGSGDAKAIRALFDDWESRSPAGRFEIVKALGEQSSPYVIGPSTFRLKDPIPSETWAIAIKRLVRALEDAEVQHSSGSHGDFEYSNTQIGDFALWALNQIDGEMFPFPPGMSRRLLDLQRIETANRWRAQHGMTLLPLPEPPGPVLSASDALKIVKVTVEPEELAETPLAQRVQDWKGKDLEQQSLFDLLNDYWQQPIEGTRGLVVEVYRRNDLTGVEVALTFKEGYAGQPPSWSMRCRGMFGESPTAEAKKAGRTRQRRRHGPLWKRWFKKPCHPAPTLLSDSRRASFPQKCRSVSDQHRAKRPETNPPCFPAKGTGGRVFQPAA